MHLTRLDWIVKIAHPFWSFFLNVHELRKWHWIRMCYEKCPSSRVQTRPKPSDFSGRKKSSARLPFLMARNLKQEIKMFIFINTFRPTLQRVFFVARLNIAQGSASSLAKKEWIRLLPVSRATINILFALHATLAELPESHEYFRKNQPDYRWSVSVGRIFSRVPFFLTLNGLEFCPF